MNLSKKLKNVKVIKYDDKNMAEIVDNLPPGFFLHDIQGNEIVLCDGRCDNRVHVVQGDSIINANGRLYICDAKGVVKKW